MRILADTNILVRLTEVGSVDHAAAADAKKHLDRLGHDVCIVPQVIYELWSVATRPMENNGLGMSVPEAQRMIADFKGTFRLLRDERTVYERWESIVVDYDVRGKKSHDARLLAAMLRHGVSHVLTLNSQDFARFDDITVVTPTEAATMPPGN